MTTQKKAKKEWKPHNYFLYSPAIGERVRIRTVNRKIGVVTAVYEDPHQDVYMRRCIALLWVRFSNGLLLKDVKTDEVDPV